MLGIDTETYILIIQKKLWQNKKLPLCRRTDMGTTVARGYCLSCKDFRKVERHSPNLWIHLILTIVTVGFWMVVFIPVWMLNSGKSGKWLCTECGGKSIHEGYKIQIKLTQKNNELDSKKEQRLEEVRSGESTPTYWERQSSFKMARLHAQQKKKEKQERKDAKKAAKKAAKETK